MDQEIYPRVLICAPQHSSKMYCWDAWYERVDSLTYPNFDIFLADNSQTKANVDYLNTFERVTAVYTPDRKKGIHDRMNESHKQCVEYAKKHKYTWIFHLETDVFPPLDVIERLMSRNRPIIAGTYDIDFGKRRKAMVQNKEAVPRTITKFTSIDYYEHEDPLFFDGKVKEVFHAGLGCILIHCDIFKFIKFRVIKDIDLHTDTIFASDCYQRHKDIFVDTTVQCEHYNQEWLSKK